MQHWALRTFTIWRVACSCFSPTSQGLRLSGIVSILFTGIVMKKYTLCNLSEGSQRFTTRFFHLLSSLAEAFVFIYHEFNIAMERQSWSHIGFIFFSIIFILLARAANVFSCAYILNLARPLHCQIPRQYQLALWYFFFVAFLENSSEKQYLKKLLTNYVVVIFTVLFIGGSTGTMLQALQVIANSNRYRHLYEENSNGSSIDFVGQNYNEGESTSSKFKLKLKEFRTSITSQNGEDTDEEEDPNKKTRPYLAFCLVFFFLRYGLRRAATLY